MILCFKKIGNVFKQQLSKLKLNKKKNLKIKHTLKPMSNL